MFLFLKKILFIYLTEREKESEHKQREQQKKGRSSLLTEQGAQCRAPSQDPGIMT